MVIPEPYTMEEAGHWLAASVAECKSEWAKAFVHLPLIGRWFDAYSARQYDAEPPRVGRALGKHATRVERGAVAHS